MPIVSIVCPYPKYQKRTLLTVQYNSDNKIHYLKEFTFFFCLLYKDVSVIFKNMLMQWRTKKVGTSGKKTIMKMFNSNNKAML